MRSSASRSASRCASCSAFPKAPAARTRATYVQGLRAAMAPAGKAADAYAVGPDAREALRILAAVPTRGYRQEPLHELAEAHAKKHADEPLPAFSRGEMAHSE